MSRAERKKIRNEMFRRNEIAAKQRQEAQEQFAREHPVLAGKIPILQYVAPRGTYSRSV